MPGLAGLILTLVLLPPYIRWLKAKQLGQYIREEGPASHAVKASTPTMGGACFIVACLAASLGWLWYLDPSASYKVLLVLGAAALCGAVGLVDDLAKFRRKANAGLSARLRLLVETCIGLALGAGLLWTCGFSCAFIPPLFTRQAELVGAWHTCREWVQQNPDVFGSSAAALMAPEGLLTVVDLPAPFFLLVSAFFVSATTNAINLHDGMDGLAAGTSAQVLAAMAVILLATGQWPLAAVAASAAGSVAAFLVFNRYPASIFMGDTGSLFVGGLMASMAIAGGIEIWFVPLAAIYIFETLSVMMQVVYFKLTKEYPAAKPMSRLALVWLKLTKRLPGEGKRLFRMAPLHHHFEAIALEKGYKEWQVVACFWVVQLLLCVLVLVLLPAR